MKRPSITKNELLKELNNNLMFFFTGFVRYFSISLFKTLFLCCHDLELNWTSARNMKVFASLINEKFAKAI